jgi:hypothetical protein
LKGVVILQRFAGGYNPDEDFKEKCQIDSLAACRQGPFRMSNIEQGTSKFKIRHPIFDIRSRSGRPGSLARSLQHIELSSIKKRFDWEKPYLGHSSLRRPEPERDERRCLLWH